MGCTARIVELVERYEDGRMLILVEGSRRFKLNSILTGKPYYVGEVEYLEEEPEEDVPALAEECRRCSSGPRRRRRRLVGIEICATVPEPLTAIAGRIDFEVETRQQILELTSEKGKLEKVKELLSAAAERLGARAAGARRPRRTAPSRRLAAERRRRRSRTASGRGRLRPPFRSLGASSQPLCRGRFFSTSSVQEPLGSCAGWPGRPCRPEGELRERPRPPRL